MDTIDSLEECSALEYVCYEFVVSHINRCTCDAP